MADILKQRPVYRNIHVSQLRSYRLPPAGWVSILHRISGVLLTLLLPFAIWMLDKSLTSEVSFDQFRSLFAHGVAGLPGWFFKLVALGLIWGYVQHFFAGLRHLWMDITLSVDLEFGRISALGAIALAVIVTLALAFKLFF